MRVKQSEICTNGPWRMRTGHANGMRWIPGRRAVAHVEAQKTRECKIRKMHENVKCAGYANAWIRENARCAKMRNARKREMRGNAKCAETRNARKCRNAKTPKPRKRENRENTKIAKVAALQQVQYKVLLYGLYAPVETWVSTPQRRA
jgi:hypothetical protein